MSKRRPNRGSFQPGPDPRRHVFTQTERRKGYASAWNQSARVSADLHAWLWRKVRSYYRAQKREV